MKENRIVILSLVLILIVVFFGWVLISSGAGNFKWCGVDDRNFTIVVLPDTQRYSQNYPEVFTNQTKWILSQREERNIVFVIHEGDIVQNSGNFDEWDNANRSLSLLDGRVAYSVVQGNHDTSSLYNEYFPVSRFSKYSWFGGNYSSNENNYFVISEQGVDLLIISLRVCPKEDEIVWANSVLEENPDKKVIIVTHGYLNTQGQRNVHVCGSTEYIWQDLIVPNENVFMVLSGHVHGEANRTDVIGEREVHQLLADYQGRNNGGDGWLRIMEFSPKENLIYVTTYSPYLDEFENDSGSKFQISY